ncbi:MAG: hypothetical protein IMZ53_03340 [Thermoplasmata archaeon]|nr:hypothetical protein [Thermoplasmata archaeon]
MKILSMRTKIEAIGVALLLLAISFGTVFATTHTIRTGQVVKPESLACKMEKRSCYNRKTI